VAHILIVSTHAGRTSTKVTLLQAAGHTVVVALDFDAAVRALVEHPPDLLMADVRLGAFNGLHLATRCQDDYPATSAMVFDTRDDAITKQDARRHRAIYLVEPLDDAELLAQVSRAVATKQAPHRRWPRKHPIVSLAAQVAERPARMVDLSYGGFRIEVPGLDQLQARFEVALPSYGVAIRAKSVWTRHVPSGSFWCGAELSDSDGQSGVVWRHIVDSVATPA
jgi:DNA-binding response OmpR family regulator